jgi:hypothetical protein
MPALTWDDAEVQFAADGAEYRAIDAGEMTVSFVRVPAGADFRPALKGLEGDMCQCPHWGMLLKGKIRMHTPDGVEEYSAGDVVHWPAGHAPEALEDSEYVDFSPPEQLREVLDHVKSGGGG